jgi:hypothetical protein
MPILGVFKIGAILTGSVFWVLQKAQILAVILSVFKKNKTTEPTECII